MEGHVDNRWLSTGESAEGYKSGTGVAAWGHAPCVRAMRLLGCGVRDVLFQVQRLVRVSAGTSRHSGEGCKSQTVKVQPTTLAPSHA